MAEEGLRRSTRVRKQVKSYAAEQAEEEERGLSVQAPKRKRKQPVYHDDDDDEQGNDDDYANDVDGFVPVPTRKVKKKSKSLNEDDEARADGWTKKGVHLFVTDPKSISTDNSWHADAAERRIAASKRNVTKLARGEEEKRLRP